MLEMGIKVQFHKNETKNIKYETTYSNRCGGVRKGNATTFKKSPNIERL